MKRILALLLPTLLLLSLTPQLTATPQEEKTVINFYANYNPPPVGHFNFFAPGHIPSDLVLEPLTHLFLFNGTYVPGIAYNWTLSEDYKVLTVKIRKGVKWHDGTELTTKDIYGTWLCIALINPGWPFPTQIIEKIEVVDDYTIVFYAKRPHARFDFGILWHWDYIPYHQYKHIIDKVIKRMKEGKDPFAHPEDFEDLKRELLDFRPKTYIGTGPYKIKTVTEEVIVLEKFKDYWNGEPEIDEVRIHRTPSADILWSLLLEGKLDWYWGTPTPEQLEQLKAKPWFGTIKIVRTIGPMIYFNHRKYPLSLKEVRQAIAYAINRTELAWIEWPIGGIPEEYIIGFASLYAERYFNETFMKTIEKFKYEYNPKKAEEILKGLGFKKGPDGIWVTPNGTKLEFELLVGGWLKTETCEALAAQLEKVGIKVTPRKMDQGTFMERFFKPGKFDMAVNPYGGASFSFSEIFYKYNKLFPSQGYSEIQKVPWLPEPVNVTRLVELYETYPVNITLQERNEIFATLAYICGEQVVTIPLFGRPVIIAYNKEKFTGWPSPEDGFWQSLASYMTRGRSYLLRWRIIKPLYSLEISVEPSEGGTTTPTPGTYRYAKGAKVTVTAKPASGYKFERWELDGAVVGKEPTITVTMDKSHKLKAVFSKVQPPYALYAGIAVVIIIIVIIAYYFFVRRRT